MSQLAISDSQPGDWDELDCFLRRLEAERFQEYGWQEPYESRGSRTVLEVRFLRSTRLSNRYQVFEFSEIS